LSNRQFLFCFLALGAALTAGVWWSDASQSQMPSTPTTLQIRPFNYPRTKPATTQPTPKTPSKKTIRVGLAQDRGDQFTLAVDGEYSVRRIGETTAIEKLPKLAASRVVATKKGIRIGGKEYAETKLEVVPESSPNVWVDGHEYRGTVRIVRKSETAIQTVNVLPLDEYLASVVDSEMPAEFGEAARQAQAIVARTYAQYQMQQSGAGSPYDLHASTRSQKYLGFQYRADGGRLLAGESTDSRRIVAETRGQVLTSRGRLFCTYYCAVCGGHTLNGSELFADAAAPLRSVPCTWCEPARNYRWSVEILKATFADAAQRYFRQKGIEFGQLRSVRSVGTTSSGELPEFELRGDRGTQRITGDVLRKMLWDHGVLSPRMTVTEQKSTWLVAGSGHGHGAGMCQWGARGMGQSGKTCQQILSHYYPGAEITGLSVVSRQPSVDSGATPTIKNN
jgi:stage II sporulation protein D